MVFGETRSKSRYRSLRRKRKVAWREKVEVLYFSDSTRSLEDCKPRSRFRNRRVARQNSQEASEPSFEDMARDTTDDNEPSYSPEANGQETDEDMLRSNSDRTPRRRSIELPRSNSVAMEGDGPSAFTSRGRKVKKVNLNEEKMFRTGYEDGASSLKRVRSGQSSLRKSHSRDSSQSQRTNSPQVSTRSGRLVKQINRDEDDDSMDEALLRVTTPATKKRKAEIDDEDHLTSPSVGRRSPRSVGADDDFDPHDKEEPDYDPKLENQLHDEDDGEMRQRRSNRVRKSGASYRETDSENDGQPIRQFSSGAGKTTAKQADDSSEEDKIKRRSDRLKPLSPGVSPGRSPRIESLKSPKKTKRRLRHVDRDRGALRRRASMGSQRKSSSGVYDHDSDDIRRSLRPRSSRRPLVEVPNSQIELRRRSRDSSDDAFSPPSSDDDESEFNAHISEEEKYDVQRTANQLKDLPPRERAVAAKENAEIAADLARETRRSRPYRARVRDMFLDQVKTGGEAKKPQIEPVKVDPSITWETVGGLDSHIRMLKEMVLLPLLYPEVFEKFKMEPPKGVLFYGPPGTGKTLCARALAASGGIVETTDGEGNKVATSRVSFFVRNGADCLSKWVGEAERNLRQMFEVAKKHQPSIIFFDEIDGLAPVRSSRQDQIHSSIVSTLLGLMDGLESRGQIVVIGATNRIDSIDPALRRAGRFDRELIFKLPNVSARKRILQIHTKNWEAQLDESLVRDLAGRTVGYCGADLKSLCTEATLQALRRRYPQIYESKEKLLINPDEVKVKRVDFFLAMQKIVPSSHRSSLVLARPLDGRISPVLYPSLQKAKEALKSLFRQGISSSGADFGDSNDIGDAEADLEFLLYEEQDIAGKKVGDLESLSRAMQPPVHSPRLLICGDIGMGQEHVGPAVLHALEGCPVQSIDLAALCANPSSRSQEEALVLSFREAARSAPSILYIPYIDTWWNTATESLRAVFLLALRDMPSDLPVLVLSTSQVPVYELPLEVQGEFANRLTLSAPEEAFRRELFDPLFADIASPLLTVDPAKRAAELAKRKEPLPKAPPMPVKQATEEEKVHNTKKDEQILRTMRMEMRELLARLLNDRKYMVFWNPVDPAEASDYYDIIKRPVDLSMIASNIDACRYATVMHMVSDVDQMVQNAIEYNPPHTEQGARILRRAHALIDLVHCWADNLDKDFIGKCNDIVARRKREEEKKLEEKKLEEKKLEEEKKNVAAEEGAKSKVATPTNVDKKVDIPANGSVKEELGLKPERRKMEILADGMTNSGVKHDSEDNSRMEMDKKIETPDGTSNVNSAKTAPAPVENLANQSDRVSVFALLNGSSKPGEKKASQQQNQPPLKSLKEQLEVVVRGCDGWNVDQLYRLYIALATVLYDNRKNANRVAVLRSMGECFDEVLASVHRE